MVVAVFVPSLLAADRTHINQAFQQWPALPFVLVGTVMVLTRLRRRRISLRIMRGAVVLWTTMLGSEAKY